MSRSRQKPKKKRKWPWIILVFVFIVIVGAMTNDDEATEPADGSGEQNAASPANRVADPVPEREATRREPEPAASPGLSETQRREIWDELARIGHRAMIDAEAKYPLQPELAMTVGQELRLVKETPFGPYPVPSDPMVGAQQMRRLPAGTIIRIVEVRPDSLGKMYVAAAASSSGVDLGKGTILSLPLQDQFDMPADQQGRQFDYMDELEGNYRADLCQEYGVTDRQLDEVFSHGLDQGWRYPELD